MKKNKKIVAFKSKNETTFISLYENKQDPENGKYLLFIQYCDENNDIIGRGTALIYNDLMQAMEEYKKISFVFGNDEK